jgi:hypothetical protein
VARGADLPAAQCAARSDQEDEMQETIQIGYQAYTTDGGEVFGAVRDILPEEVVVYVENAGDFHVPKDAVARVHSQKVVFDCEKLDPKLRRAIDHAHDAEEPGL